VKELIMQSQATASVRQATVLDPRRVEVVRGELSSLPEGYARIAVEVCGVCGSDLTMYRGNHPVIRPPIVLGHEVIGTISEIAGPAAGGFVPGARVAFLPQVGCGNCAPCRRGDERLCAQMKLIGGQIPGGLAEAVVVPVGNLIGVPDSVPRLLQVLVEPLAVAVHAAGRVALTSEDDCVVLGCGPIGALVGFVLRARGVAKITMVDPDEGRRATMAYFGFHVAEGVPVQPDMYDVAFECVGGAKPAETALAAVRADGHVVLVGVAAPALNFSGVQLQRQERTITGSHMYRRQEFESAFSLLARGVVPHDAASLQRLIEIRELDDIAEIMRQLDSRAVAALKIVVYP
jgi:threonine dehydrogenase-like Zn-dependent dehydrogenase